MEHFELVVVLKLVAAAAEAGLVMALLEERLTVDAAAAPMATAVALKMGAVATAVEH